MERVDEKKLTEADLQLAIHHYRACIQAFPIILTNIYFWYWESDAIYITADGYVQEFECKISHSDFLADAKKETKHVHMANGRGPSHFWYVCPPGIIPVDEVPEHAGLFYTHQPKPCPYSEETRPLTLQMIKKAPRIKSEPIRENKWRELLSKACVRYWDVRKRRDL